MLRIFGGKDFSSERTGLHTTADAKTEFTYVRNMKKVDNTPSKCGVEVSKPFCGSWVSFFIVQRYQC